MARGLTADILDGLSSSTAIKGPASIAFTTNVALSGEVTAQGFTTSESRVLVTGNTDPKENGLWRTSTGDWSRCKDFSRNDDVRPGTIVNVIEGDYFGPWAVVCDDDPVIMDVTSITFQHFPDWLGITSIGTMAQATIKGRASGAGTGAPTDLTATQVKVIVREVGEVTDYAGSSLPAGWLYCAGQNVSRTTYALLFAAIGTTFGVGDGSTTFGVPDLRGRVVAGKDDMGGSGASRITSGGQAGITGSTLGAAGGAQDNTLDTTRIPSHSHGVTDPGHNHSFAVNATNTGSGTSPSVGNNPPATSGTTGSRVTGITIDAAGGGGAHNNVQPTMIMNKIIFTGV